MCLFTLTVAPVSAADALDSTRYSAESLSQHWIKRGRILEPGFAPQTARLVSAPSVVKLDNGRLRLYFWAADGLPEPPAPFPWSGHHRIFAVEADPANPFDWKLVSSEPMLGPEPGNNIRDGGVAFPFIVPRENEPWLMFYGTWGSWGKDNQLANRTGLALSHDQGLTWKVRKEVVLPLGKPGSHDAVLTGSVDVKQAGRNEYMMWYTAGQGYITINGVRNNGIVHLGLARSSNGIDWVKAERPALSPRLDQSDPFERIVSKPSVLKIDDVYHMWFSVKKVDTPGYRIEYARSSDGIRWERFADQSVLSLTPGGFDSEHQSYPNVVDMGDQLWMFYVGNSYGFTGIGLATLDKSQL